MDILNQFKYYKINSYSKDSQSHFLELQIIKLQTKDVSKNLNRYEKPTNLKKLF